MAKISKKQTLKEVFLAVARLQPATLEQIGRDIREKIAALDDIPNKKIEKKLKTLCHEGFVHKEKDGDKTLYRIDGTNRPLHLYEGDKKGIIFFGVFIPT